MRLTGRIYNASLDVKQDLSSAHTVACNAISQSAQIGDFFLRTTPAGYQLLVLGRNGEPLARQAVTLQLKLRQFTNRQDFSLATDEEGTISLGELQNVAVLTASAQGLEASSFELKDFDRRWPSLIQLGARESLELPLGKPASEPKHFALYEIRGNSYFADASSKIEMLPGSLKIAELAAGDYLLEDYESGQRVSIRVANAETENQFATGEYRSLQTTRLAPLVIRQAAVEGDQLRIRVDGADAMTRVHIIAQPLWPESLPASHLHLPYPPLASKAIPALRSLYVDSLRLDEEYSYILDRQGLKKFPGNMLPQPSVLVNPWEVSVTENVTVDAAAGDAIPPMAAQAAGMDKRAAEGEVFGFEERPDWKSYDFLARGAALATNLAVDGGQVSLPLEKLAGFSNVTVIAVHPTLLDSRQVTLPMEPLAVRDQRNSRAFDAEQHLAQTQRVRILAAGEKVALGDCAHPPLANLFEHCRRLPTLRNVLARSRMGKVSFRWQLAAIIRGRQAGQVQRNGLPRAELLLVSQGQAFL